MYDAILRHALTPRHVAVFFCFAIVLYIYPLVNADFAFYDDIYRSNVADANWIGEGRPLIQVYYHLLSFSDRVPNLFPLPLMIALSLLVLALTRLVFWCFAVPTLTGCLVVLPVLYNPYFLQGLSYQYDGATMTLSLVAIIYAITLNVGSRWKQLFASSVLIFVALALYQVSINFLVVLCCFEVAKYSVERKPVAQIFSIMGVRLGAVVLAGLIYFLSVYPFMGPNRLGMLPFSAGSLYDILLRSVDIADRITSPFPVAFKVLMVGLSVIAFLGYLWAGKQIIYCEGTRWYKAGLMAVYLLIIPTVYFSLSGIGLLFESFNTGYRTLSGVSGALVLMFFFIHKWLARFRGSWAAVLMLPLLYSLCVSYAYGRVLTLQKNQEASILTNLAYDIHHSELKSLEKLYIVNYWIEGTSPAIAGLHEVMPVLKQISGFAYILLPEMLPRVGIDNVYVNRVRSVEEDIKRGKFKASLVTPVYEFYMVDGAGYILMNPMKPGSFNDCLNRVTFAC